MREGEDKFLSVPNEYALVLALHSAKEEIFDQNSNWVFIFLGFHVLNVDVRQPSAVEEVCGKKTGVNRRI